MRTTITINDNLARALKMQAVQADQTVSQLIEDAVKYQLLEDFEDLQAVKDCENEPAKDFDQFVQELKADGLL